jgi:hypothetical protein
MERPARSELAAETPRTGKTTQGEEQRETQLETQLETQRETQLDNWEHNRKRNARETKREFSVTLHSCYVAFSASIFGCFPVAFPLSLSCVPVTSRFPQIITAFPLR